MVVLTHSVDLIRNMHLQHDKIMKHYLLTPYSDKGHKNIFDDDMNLIVGLEFLPDRVLTPQREDKKIGWDEMLAILPMIRDISESSKLIRYPSSLECPEDIRETLKLIHSTISSDFLHYNPNKTVTVEDLFNFLKNYTDKPIHTNVIALDKTHLKKNTRCKMNQPLIDVMKTIADQSSRNEIMNTTTRIYNEIVKKFVLSIYARWLFEKIMYDTVKKYSKQKYKNILFNCLNKRFKLSTKAIVIKEMVKKNKVSWNKVQNRKCFDRTFADFHQTLFRYKNLVNAFQHPQNTGLVTIVETPVKIFKEIIVEIRRLERNIYRL